jgi:hypothetical protein
MYLEAQRGAEAPTITNWASLDAAAASVEGASFSILSTVLVSFSCFHFLSYSYSLCMFLRLNLPFDSRQGQRFFLLTTASRPALVTTQRRIQLVPGVLSPEVKRLGHEAEHSPPSITDVKNEWSYTSTPPIRLHGVVLN